MKEYTIRLIFNHCEEISKQRLEQFVKYHNANEKIWYLFRHTAEIALQRKQRFSSKAIFEIIRWERSKVEGSDGFKVNNNYTSLYSRLLEATCPHFEGFFHHRAIRSQINEAEFDKEGGIVHNIV